MSFETLMRRMFPWPGNGKGRFSNVLRSGLCFCPHCANSSLEWKSGEGPAMPAFEAAVDGVDLRESCAGECVTCVAGANPHSANEYHDAGSFSTREMPDGG